MEEILQNLGQEDYKALYRELHCIPPPKHGSYSMLGIKLWLLTSPMRSWTEIAWGLYRSCLDNADKALKQARDEIIEDEGEKIYLCVSLHQISLPDLTGYLLGYHC